MIDCADAFFPFLLPPSSICLSTDSRTACFSAATYSSEILTCAAVITATFRSSLIFDVDSTTDRFTSVSTTEKSRPSSRFPSSLITLSTSSL